MNFACVVLGGTFDRLHTGHVSLLSKAFSVGRRVTIGLTTDEYVHKIKDTNEKPVRIATQSVAGGPARRATLNVAGGSKIFSYIIRKRYLDQWLKNKGWSGRYTIVPLNDSYGPTINPSSDFDSIVVSAETRKTADEINVIRKKNGMSALSVVEIPMIPAQDLIRISSTRIRNGEIDTTGRLVLPDNLRPELRKSLGTIISHKDLKSVLKKEEGNVIITVGDMTTERVLLAGVKPHLGIIDFQMKRKPFLWDKALFETFLNKSRVYEIQSGPGYISQDAFHAIESWGTTFKGDTLHGVYSNRTVLLVDGEEDLLVLPAVVEASKGSIIYYGQPREGIIRVVVTDKIKKLARTLLGQFIRA